MCCCKAGCLLTILLLTLIEPCCSLLLGTGASPGHQDAKTIGGDKAIETAAKQVARLPTGCNATEDCECYRNPKVWGPPTWFFLHTMTLAMPDKIPKRQQHGVKQLMLDMQDVLPCPSCGDNLKNHMDENPIDSHVQERASLVQWMVDLHNVVNRHCGKREWSLDEVLARYDEAYKQPA
mmetsp:Transcript_45884/g.106673  ORF Transcript_45884/g.106673 Transcript_45884/m.106673 type:complete len:179 (+) Transcript_45884:94-630(+)